MSDSLIAFQPAIEEPSNIDAVGEHFLVDDRHVEGDVLPLAARIGEAEVDVFDVVVLDRLEHVLGGLHASVLFFPCYESRWPDGRSA